MIRVGGASAIVAGLALVYITVQNVFLTAGLFGPPRPLSYRPPLAVSILHIVALPAIPLGILVGVIGLLILIGSSSVARWGVALAVVATFLLIVDPFVTYIYWIASNDASPGYDTIAAMLFLSRALSVLSSLLLAAGIVLLYVADQRHQRLGVWGKILPAIAIATVLSSTAPSTLPAVGLAGGTTFDTVSGLVVELLWLALGVAIWRHVPENGNIGTSPLTS